MSGDEDAFAGTDELDSGGPSWTDLCVSATDIARDGVRPVEFDVDGLLESLDGPTIISADSGAFKSWLALFVAAAVLHGTPFLGKYATRARPYVLYVNLDAGGLGIKRRIECMGLVSEHFFVLSPDSWDEVQFEALLERYAGAFVVIDCMADAFEPLPGEDQAVATRRFLRKLRKLFERHRCSGFLIDHANRRGDYYGSAQRKAAIRMMWHVDRLADGDRLTNTIRVRCAKPGEAEPFEPFMVEFDFTGALVSIRPIDAVPKRASNSAGKLKAELRDWSRRQEKPFSKNAAEQGVSGYRSGEKRAAIDELITSGEWIAIAENRNHPLYSPATSSSSGTKSDEVDEVQAVPERLDFVPIALCL